MKIAFRLIPIVFAFLLACSEKNETPSKTLSKSPGGTTMSEAKLETATLGGGCFWCTEAVYQRLKGVKKVVSGYSDDFVDKPTYRQICESFTVLQ